MFEPWEKYEMSELDWLRLTNDALRRSRLYWYEEALKARDKLSEALRGSESRKG